MAFFISDYVREKVGMKIGKKEAFKLRLAVSQ
jgi:hypothetical protein